MPSAAGPRRRRPGPAASPVRRARAAYGRKVEELPAGAVRRRPGGRGRPGRRPRAPRGGAGGSGPGPGPPAAPGPDEAGGPDQQPQRLLAGPEAGGEELGVEVEEDHREVEPPGWGSTRWRTASVPMRTGSAGQVAGGGVDHGHADAGQQGGQVLPDPGHPGPQDLELGAAARGADPGPGGPQAAQARSADARRPPRVGLRHAPPRTARSGRARRRRRRPAAGPGPFRLSTHTARPAPSAGGALRRRRRQGGDGALARTGRGRGPPGGGRRLR